MSTRHRTVVLSAVFLILALVASTALQSSSAQGPAVTAAPTEPQPVEDDMHEFMEYAFEPAYLRLKQALAAQPANNVAWKGIKSDALTLAEGGNLLLLRPDSGDAAAWNDLSTAVRQAGKQLYAAGKKRDFATARPAYEAMLLKCNACHTKFADGEHQLVP